MDVFIEKVSLNNYFILQVFKNNPYYNKVITYVFLNYEKWLYI